MALLQVEDLGFTYPDASAPTLRQVSFCVERGECVLLCGQTGCGKSTLLRLLKRELAPHGKQTGRILYLGKPQSALDDRQAASLVGYVMQRPEDQIVTDKVWHELAFGLESLGLPQSVIRRRTAEMAAYFGIDDWFARDTASLSGGQKQLLNLASVMAMQPEILLLDEPTAQLDPIAAATFLSTLQRLHRELGLTILLAEHRLEEAFAMADRVLVLEAGSVLLCDRPAAAAAALRQQPKLLPAMPCAVQLFHGLGAAGDCPLTVGAGRTLLTGRFQPEKATSAPPTRKKGAEMLTLRDVWFRYDKASPDVLRGASMTVYAGEIFCLLGGNGSGKTTLLTAAAGLCKPYAGTLSVCGKPIRKYQNGSLYALLAMLPQDPQTLFLHETVQEELADAAERLPALPFDLTPLYDRHPYDLSGGEQQLCALAKVLARKPKLLLLDEPTKGVDAFSRLRLLEILRKLRDGGMTLLVVTHDVEFAAACADRCGLFFRGELLAEEPPQTFFAENRFYTTAASRMARDLFPDAITCEAVLEQCRAQKGTSI